MYIIEKTAAKTRCPECRGEIIPDTYKRVCRTCGLITNEFAYFDFQYVMPRKHEHVVRIPSSHHRRITTRNKPQRHFEKQTKTAPDLTIKLASGYSLILNPCPLSRTYVDTLPHKYHGYDLYRSQIRFLHALEAQGYPIFFTAVNGMVTSIEMGHIPENITLLTELEALYIFECHLASISKSIRALPKLRVLSLVDNNIEEIPDWIGELTQLEDLDLTYNLISVIPESLGELRNLRTLDLSHNYIETVPESLRHLTRLRALQLDNNQIMELPDIFIRMTELTKFQIHHNLLTTLPASLFSVPGMNVTLLEINDNRLSAIPEEIGRLHHIRRLDLRGNPIRDISDALWTLPYLEEVLLDMTSKIYLLCGDHVVKIRNLVRIFM